LSLIGHALGLWVGLCERRPRAVLGLLGLMTVAAGVYVAENFAIDSDLSKLIRPSGDQGWFETNETIKRLFPELQQTSVVVVSGEDADRVDLRCTTRSRRSEHPHPTRSSATVCCCHRS